MPTNAERLAALFKGFDNAHGTYSEPQKETKPSGIKWGISTSARTIRKPATIELFEKHLAGEYPLGIIPITERGGCWWGGIDVDDYSINPLEMVQKIEQGKYPLVPVLSKSGGLHLFLFLQEEMSAALVQTILQNLAAKLGVANAEIFPKQVKVLTERGDLGNWLCIPMLGTTFGGKLSEQAAIKKTGAKLTIEEFLNLAENSKVSAEELKKWEHEAERKPRLRHPSQKDEEDEIKLDFEDGPPCLQFLAEQGVPDGGRNNTLFMMALYYIRKDFANWQSLVENANRKYFKPPLSSEEVVSVIRSVEKKGARNPEEGYKYTCKVYPVANHCNSKLCRGKRHGIGSAEEIPKLSGISKLDTEPPIWFVNVGDIRIEATTDQLQNYFRFHALCMDKGNVCFRMIKQPDWLVLLGDAMQQDVTLIEVSAEVSVTGQFKELLDDFLTDRQIADDKEELLRGLPWADLEKGRVYFKLSSLQQFLEKQNFKAFSRGRIVQKIRDFGGDHHFFTLKGRGLNVWWLPLVIFPSTVHHNPPEIKKSPI